MKVTRNHGSRTMTVHNLPKKHKSDVGELTIKVDYTGSGNALKGIALDHIIIPAIVDGLNRERLPADALEAIAKRKAAAAKWAEDFNAPARQYRGKNAALRSKPKKALGVIVLTESVRDYLAEHDPMALMQAQQALNEKDYTNYLTD